LVLTDFWNPLPFATSRFDAVVALHGTLAHPPDDNSTGGLAGELARVVRPGGALVVEVPSPAWLDRAAANPEREGAWRCRRTGPRTCVIEDAVVGATIEARVMDAEQWIEVLAPSWNARVEPLGELEWLVVAKRI
jgi:SAM-dependent methyltransferase